MNAMAGHPSSFIESAEERAARHVNYFREMAELSMQLLRIAAHKALQAAEETADPARKPAGKTPDPILNFIRLSRAVREAVALEARIDASRPATRAPATRAPATQAPAANKEPPDPRRDVLRLVIDQAIPHEPPRSRIRHALTERIEAELARDPDYTLPASTLLDAIVEDFHLDIKFDKLSDQALADLLPERFTPPAPRIGPTTQ